jgi:hypothetical protein
MSEAGRVPDGVDVTRPSPARLYDYYLGGTHNFEVDRIAADKLREIMPELSDMAWSNRGFHQRAAEFIAAQGIRQFIDIGSGLPATGNTHEVVLKVAPDARVVYVDHDPMVAAMAEGLIADPESAQLIEADVREPDVLLSHPVLTEMIDFSQPVGLLMTAVMHFVADASKPKALIGRYVKALAPGSYLALSQGTSDNLPPKMVQAAKEMYKRSTERLYPRPRAAIESFFEGLEIVEPYPGAGPNLCFVGMWGADDPEAADSDGSRIMYCGVARRP